jgi:hypothetical protein
MCRYVALNKQAVVVDPPANPRRFLYFSGRENMNYIVFYGLAYRYAHKLITRREFIEGWKAEQQHQGINAVNTEEESA